MIIISTWNVHHGHERTMAATILNWSVSFAHWLFINHVTSPSFSAMARCADDSAIPPVQFRWMGNPPSAFHRFLVCSSLLLLLLLLLLLFNVKYELCWRYPRLQTRLIINLIKVLIRCDLADCYHFTRSNRMKRKRFQQPLFFKTKIPKLYKLSFVQFVRGFICTYA